MEKDESSGKVLVLGDSFTGKTAFFASLSAESSGSIVPTYGCDVHPVLLEDHWFDFYELGGGNFTSQANYRVLSSAYSGYIFFFDANNVNSLKLLPEFVRAINRVTSHDIKAK
eukprot:TRINITY_DN17285_c0_g1_i1.p3 TRINITY_DN17285_c0_g1~~TRINITY_DN17285_c0_g1_i1.p3  ORF type:complete len:113 (-),score=32.11 TRINITY_DN17285_c0_g1_i1:508-846(-)